MLGRGTNVKDEAATTWPQPGDYVRIKDNPTMHNRPGTDEDLAGTIQKVARAPYMPAGVKPDWPEPCIDIEYRGCAIWLSNCEPLPPNNPTQGAAGIEQIITVIQQLQCEIAHAAELERALRKALDHLSYAFDAIAISSAIADIRKALAGDGSAILAELAAKDKKIARLERDVATMTPHGARCGACGHTEFGENAIEAIKAHINSCGAHPMQAVRAELKKTRLAVDRAELARGRKALRTLDRDVLRDRLDRLDKGLEELAECAKCGESRIGPILDMLAAFIDEIRNLVGGQP